jgi:ERO1-like protein alpha
MCFEEKVLYRLLSGMHTATNVHINWMYYPPRKGIRTSWQPNPARFAQQYGQHPDRIENVYFAFVVLLRAVRKSSNVLLHHDFSSIDDRTEVCASSVLRGASAAAP